MIRCLTQLRAVVVLKNYRVFNIYGIIRCSICGITRTSDYFLIPTSKLISIRVIRGFRRNFRRSHFITVMVRLITQLRAVIVLENNRVFDINRSIGSRIYRIPSDSYDFLIPTDKFIGIGIIRFTSWIIGNRNNSPINISCAADDRSVVILENDLILVDQLFVNNVFNVVILKVVDHIVVSAAIYGDIFRTIKSQHVDIRKRRIHIERSKIDAAVEQPVFQLHDFFAETDCFERIAIIECAGADFLYIVTKIKLFDFHARTERIFAYLFHGIRNSKFRQCFAIIKGCFTDAFTFLR